MTAEKGTETKMYDLVCKDRFDSIDEKLTKIYKVLIEGNGKESLIVRMDRVEQVHKSASKAFWVAVSAFITAIVGTVWSIVMRSRGG